MKRFSDFRRICDCHLSHCAFKNSAPPPPLPELQAAVAEIYLDQVSHTVTQSLALAEDSSLVPQTRTTLQQAFGQMACVSAYE